MEVDEADYVGRDYREVRERLDDLGLSPVLNELDNDGTHEAGTVDGLNPTGSLSEGDSITISYWGEAPATEEPTPEPTPTETQTPSESSSPLLGAPSEEATQ